MKNTWKKLLAVTLVTSMLTGMLGVGTLAAEEENGEQQVTSAGDAYSNREDTQVIPTPAVTGKPEESEKPVETEVAAPPVESEVSNGDGGIMLLSAGDEAEVDPTITAFLEAVAEIPEEITGENWEEAQSKVDAAQDLYGPVYDLWKQDNTIWTEEVSDAYQVLKAAKQAIVPFKLAAYPITGEWSVDENGKVLTLTGTGESSYVGTFVLVEDGQRVELVSNLRTDTTLAPFRVVLNDVTEVGISAFYGCKKLTGIDLGSVATIGKYAFQECSALTEVEGLENVTTIGDQSFMKAFDASADVTVRLNGAAVGAYAFNKSNLDHLEAAGLTAIGKQAFLGTTVQDVVIGIAERAELSQDFFYNSKQLTDLTVTGDLLVKNSFRGCSALETVTLNDVTEIGESAFMDCPKLETVTGLGSVARIAFRSFYRDAALTTVDLSGVKTIGYEAFSGTSLTGDYDLSGVEHVEFNAFKGCENANITVGENTVLEHSDVFSRIPSLQERIAAILAGRFTLNPANAIDTLAPLGWTSNKAGRENDNETYGGTQLTKEARWADKDSTVADVTIQAYYTDVAQMDFIFVLDLSNSMAKVGNVEAGDKNARLYDMQSKLLDVTGKLMTTPGYDCRVAFTGFGETSSLTSGKFFAEAGEAAGYINGLQTYYENTNYSLGLEKAEDLVAANTGRNTTVVFISDGQPYKNGEAVPPAYCGYEAAQTIKDAGVEIYAVLQSIPEGELENAQSVMQAICTDGKYFTASQTAEFSEAVNDAIACGFTTYTLVDTVGDDFDLAWGTVRASAGEVAVSEDGRTITWTIVGMPFETHTLTFQENLKQVNGVYPYGSFDTNKEDAELKLGDETVNQVETPVLSRTEPTPTEKPTESPEDPEPTDDPDPDPVRPSPDPKPTVTPTPRPSETPEPAPTESPVIEELGENDTPLAELPKTEQPATEPPKEEIEELEDEDVPLAEVPETGDDLGAWLMMSAGALLGLAWLGKKREEA